MSNSQSSNGQLSNSKLSNSQISWPFGYGLSYTTFDYSNLQMPEEVKTDEQSLTLTFDVKNTGKMAADEIVQIYLSPTEENQNIRPIQLQGFARVSLQPGETKKVSVKLYTEQFGYFNKKDGQRQWSVDPGTYAVKVGASSVDFRLQQQVKLTGQTVSKPIRDYYFSEVTLQ